jgi:5-formyltetrahydrofolate cyclo-ligase
LAKSTHRDPLQSLRRKMVAKRRALTAEARRLAAARAARRFWRMAPARRARTVACYAAVRGEISCDPIIATAIARGVTVCMPVVRRDRLVFATQAAHERTRRNRFGIPEPLAAYARRRLSSAIDVIVMPLVAFDHAGRRLGTGRGYYDRTLQSVARRKWRRRPLLVGIAYDFQCVAQLPERPWDVPMDVIITETKCIALR